MSGSADTHVSQLIPRATAQGVAVVGYDPATDSFVTLMPSALQGLQGPQGPVGPTGPQGPQGVPGSAGTNGTAVKNGTGAPAASVGVNGDFYIDTQNWVIYGPKASGAWPGTGKSLIGPQGPQGPAGTGGSGSSANLDNGTVDGQVAVWNATAGKYVPQTAVSINADRSQTVEIAAGLALTFAAHHRRNLVLTAAAPLTLAASEIGVSPAQGMEFVVQNDHSATNTLTFGAGLTVQKPGTATGGAQVVNIPANGQVAVIVYPRGASLIAKVRGDVG